MRLPNKQKPTFLLKDVKRLVELDRVSITQKCTKCADELGFSRTDVLDVLACLEQKDFIHSVPQNNNPKLWQDVYSKTIHELRLYIKFQIKVAEDKVLLLSFKQYTE